MDLKQEMTQAFVYIVRVVVTTIVTGQQQQQQQCRLKSTKG